MGHAGLILSFTVPNIPKVGSFLPMRLGRIKSPLSSPLPSARLGLAAGRESRAWSCPGAALLLGCQKQDKISPHERGAEQKGSRGSPCHQAAIRACPRCHCLLSSWGTFVSLCPVVLMCFFHLWCLCDSQ